MDFRTYETRKLSVADDLKNLAKVHWIHLETESGSFVHSVMRPEQFQLIWLQFFHCWFDGPLASRREPCAGPASFLELSIHSALSEGHSYQAARAPHLMAPLPSSQDGKSRPWKSMQRAMRRFQIANRSRRRSIVTGAGMDQSASSNN
jgi:hypothetical protein